MDKNEGEVNEREKYENKLSLILHKYNIFLNLKMVFYVKRAG